MFLQWGSQRASPAPSGGGPWVGPAGGQAAARQGEAHPFPPAPQDDSGGY